jgi:hypothetical protein
MSLTLSDAPTELLAEILKIVDDDAPVGVDNKSVVLEVRRLSGHVQKIEVKIGEIRREHLRRMN